ncbi:MAG TPA: MFS transporter, partial [Noviherbaspirillum sp.]|nr:MFS transporter [Noviherbaspirillum sp.]
EPWRIVHLLAVTQIISYGSLFYAFALLAPAIRDEFGWRNELVFGAFSLSLLVAGLGASPAGALIDRHGGRSVMAAGSVLAALGLLGAAMARSLPGYYLAWMLIGAAMATVLYEAAFATINAAFETGARRAVSVLTLYGGFASTVFWPLTLQLNGTLGWRGTFAAYAALQLCVCLPAHLAMRGRAGRAATGAGTPAHGHTLAEALRDPVFWKLACAFATNMFIFSAMSVHVIPLLQRFGHGVGTAVFLAALIGPMQVAGRLGEMTLASRFAPAAVGRVTFALLPAGLLALLMLGERQFAAALFCILYGMSNGIMTIVRGTVPIELFGRQNYGAIAGALAGPTLIAKAAGPLVLAALVEFFPGDRWLVAFLLAVALLSMAAFLAALSGRRPTTEREHGRTEQR